MEYLACTDWYIESAIFVMGKKYTFIEIYILFKVSAAVPFLA